MGASCADRLDSSEGVRLKEEQAAFPQSTMRLPEDLSRIGGAEDVELTKYQHHEIESGSVFSQSNVFVHVVAAQVVCAGMVCRIGYRRGRVVDSHTHVTPLRQTARVKTRATTQIKDLPGVALQQMVVDPVDVSIDRF